MARQFICDNCGKVFPQPLDEVSFKDEHGVTTILDLCAPCRKEMATGVEESKKVFFDKVAKKIKPNKEDKPLA